MQETRQNQKDLVPQGTNTRTSKHRTEREGDGFQKIFRGENRLSRRSQMARKGKVPASGDKVSGSAIPRKGNVRMGIWILLGCKTEVAVGCAYGDVQQIFGNI